MNDESSRTGRPSRSSLLILAAVVLMAAIGFLLADSGDLPDSEGATSGTCGEYLTWTIDSAGNLKIDGSGPMYDYGYSSTRWGGDTVRSVEIGNSVTSIGSYAFEGCYYLTAVTIPGSVTSIGENAFSWCTSLVTIVIPDSVKSIGDRAFEECASLATIAIPDSVTSIGDWAFSWCTSLTTVPIPNSVTFIGNYAFHNCTSLTTVTIPDSVKSIGWCAFSWCASLNVITVDSSNTEYASDDGVLYDKGRTELLQYPVGRTDTSFSIPDSVTFIESGAFSLCTSLEIITIPNSVTSIGIGAFDLCNSLTSVTIPDSVTFIGIGAFDRCASLTAITVDSSNTNYTSEDGVLYNKDRTELLQYPAGKADSSFSIPDSVTSIGEYAFSNCTSLTYITIPSSVSSIGAYAFLFCTSLNDIRIPDSVASIGNYTFSGCTSLTSVTIPDSVISIGEWAFQGCTSLSTIIFPESIISIGEDAFSRCNSLTTITFPDSVTTIEPYAFSSHLFYDADGVTVLEPTASNLAGYTFKGETVDRMIKQDPATLTKHSVTYDIDGGTGSAPESGQYAEGKAFVLPSYNGTKDGYIFTGWNHGGTTYAAGQTVTMSSEDMTFVANWVVKKNVTSISLSETEIVLVRGEARTLIATVYPTDATAKDIVWTSADGSVASVDENGKVTAHKLGRTTITAASADGGISASCTVSVEDRDILVVFKSTGDGDVYVMISSLDGGRIPAGKITMELNYSVYSATLEDWVDRSDSTADDPVYVDPKGTFAVMLIDLSDAKNPDKYTSAVAMFTVGEGENQTVYMSDITAYSGKIA